MAVEFKFEQRGKVATALWSVSSYLLVNMALLPMILVFFVLNRTTVVGRGNVPKEKNTLLLSNHQTMIDSFLVGLTAYYPHHFWRPYLIPWHPAAEENFFRNRLLAWFFDLLKCIPVRTGRRDLKAVYRSMRALKTGTVILFPEGTRTRDGSVGQGRPGAGLVILGEQPKVVPVAIDGMARILPIGSKIPAVGKRLSISFGEPMDFSEFSGEERSKETAQAVVDRVMAAIREQHEGLQRLRGK
jgi:1-acyl-sn-glycerol-3-phosphate acyltransferase